VVKGGHAIAPAISTYIMGCDDLPKGSQQPVIDDFEKPGHDDSYGAVEYTGGGGYRAMGLASLLGSLLSSRCCLAKPW